MMGLLPALAHKAAKPMPEPRLLLGSCFGVFAAEALEGKRQGWSGRPVESLGRLGLRVMLFVSHSGQFRTESRVEILVFSGHGSIRMCLDLDPCSAGTLCAAGDSERFSSS